MGAELRSLLHEYETTGDEVAFDRAKPLFEQAIGSTRDPDVIRDYGYLLECHGRYALRRAVELYDDAIRLDPDAEKTRLQRMSARAALGEADDEVARAEQLLDAAPGDVRRHRLLAAAYLAAHRYGQALDAVEAGLDLAQNDPALIACRGEARSAAGDVDGALADWARARELNPDAIDPLYACAFLLERAGRLPEATAAWEAIRDWARSHGYDRDAEWPEREIERLRAR